jgi:hypothetical protein
MMNQFGKTPLECDAETCAPAEGKPRSVHVHVISVTDEDGNRRAGNDRIEVIETTVAEIADELTRRGIGPDEPVTMGSSHDLFKIVR